MQNITVDLVPGRVQRLFVSQYDKNIRAFEVEDNLWRSAVCTIPDGSTVAVAGTRPDGYSFDYECQYTGNTVSVTVTEQMTVCAGKTPCEVIIYDSEANRIGTAQTLSCWSRSRLWMRRSGFRERCARFSPRQWLRSSRTGMKQRRTRSESCCYK